jgi:DNA-binding NarL/FixJ family response regulator
MPKEMFGLAPQRALAARFVTGFFRGSQAACCRPLPDVVLVNLAVSAESCFSFLAKIRQVCPKAKVIFLSNVDGLHLWIQAIQRGAYEFLPKAIDPDQLGWVLEGALVCL